MVAVLGLINTHTINYNPPPTRTIRWFFSNFKCLFFCDEAALWLAKLGFLLANLASDKFSEWYFRQLFSETQIISPLICFFVFFHANLLPAINFTGFGLVGVPAVRWTANQSSRKVPQLQHEALCKGLIFNKLTLKSLQNHHNAGRWKFFYA